MEQPSFPEVRGPFEIFVRHTETGELIDSENPIFEIVTEALPLGIYEHFKSTPDEPRFYLVEKVIQTRIMLEQLVIYLPLYTDDVQYKSARPMEMFSEMVEHEGRLVPRFCYRGPERDDDISSSSSS